MALLASKQAGLLPSKQSSLIPSKQIASSQVLWTPANIKNIYAWFDDTDATKQTLNGSAVVQQASTNSASFTGSNSTASQAPIVAANAFTGADGKIRNGLKFNSNGATGAFRFSSVNIDINNSSTFVAFLQDSGGGGFMQGCETGDRIDIYQNGFTLGIHVGGDRNVGNSSAGALVMFGYSSSGGTVTPYVNGAAGGTYTGPGTTNSQLEAGTYAGGSGSAWKGTRGGHVLAGTMTASEIAKLHGYWHWQLGTALPSNSPYTSRPPYVSDP